MQLITCSSCAASWHPTVDASPEVWASSHRCKSPVTISEGSSTGRHSMGWVPLSVWSDETVAQLPSISRHRIEPEQAAVPAQKASRWKRRRKTMA